MTHAKYALLLLLLGSVCLAEDETAARGGPVFSGRVTTPQGEPLAGARVDISTAAPKVGRGLFCPSCYLDCGKWTTTNQRGEFSIGKLDPSLRFRLVVTMSRHRTLQTDLIDPLDSPFVFELEALPEDIDAQRVVSGVVTQHGVPVAGALVEPHGAKSADRRWLGRVDGVDPTVTDTQGRFLMILPENLLAVDIEVTGHGFSGRQLTLLEPGSEPVSVDVETGASVIGKLVHDGQPSTGMSVAVVQVDRRTSNGIFIAAVGDTTNDQGEFEFRHLPDNQQYCIYSVVGEANRTDSPYVLSSKTFMVPSSGEVRDLGELEVISSYSIQGRVHRVDGKPLPRNLKLLFGRNPAWDLVEVAVRDDGSFMANGLPPETYEIRLGDRELRIVADGFPYQLLSKSSFGIRLRSSLDNLTIPVKGE